MTNKEYLRAYLWAKTDKVLLSHYKSINTSRWAIMVPKIAIAYYAYLSNNIVCKTYTDIYKRLLK